MTRKWKLCCRGESEGEPKDVASNTGILFQNYLRTLFVVDKAEIDFE